MRGSRKLFFSSAVKKQISILIFAGICLLPVMQGKAAQTAIEKQWRQQLSQQQLSGERLELEAGGSKFLAIYQHYQSKKEYGAAIVLHDKAMHPDWQKVVQPLRLQLADKGWNTLSIQLPIQGKALDLEALTKFYADGAARVAAAVDYLRQKKVANIFIIAYGRGGYPAFSYVVNVLETADKETTASIKGLVLVSHSSYIGQPVAKGQKPHPENTAAMIEKLKIPLLDIYGSYDNLAVLNSSQAKRAAANHAGIDFSQQQVLHADHFYQAQQQQLVQRIHGWMRRQIKSYRQAVQPLD